MVSPRKIIVNTYHAIPGIYAAYDILSPTLIPDKVIELLKKLQETGHIDLVTPNTASQKFLVYFQEETIDIYKSVQELDESSLVKKCLGVDVKNKKVVLNRDLEIILAWGAREGDQIFAVNKTSLLKRNEVSQLFPDFNVISANKKIEVNSPNFISDFIKDVIAGRIFLADIRNELYIITNSVVPYLLGLSLTEKELEQLKSVREQKETLKLKRLFWFYVLNKYQNIGIDESYTDWAIGDFKPEIILGVKKCAQLA